MKTKPGTAPTTPTTEGEFQRLAARANAGDEQALEQLRQVLDARPDIYQRIGDLAAYAEHTVVELVAGHNRLLAESLPRRLRDMKAELLGPATTLLERMAVDRIIATWLQVQWADCVAASAEGGTLSNAHLRLKWQRQADAAYRAAIRSLGDVRRLALVNKQADGSSLRVFDEGAQQPASEMPRPTGTEAT